MEAWVQTAQVGGSSGAWFSDIAELNSSFKLDYSHPITQIKVSHGNIVDGLEISYKVVGDGFQDAEVKTHGSSIANATVIDLNGNETVVVVFGRAGYSTQYKKNKIISISFVIFDSATANVRTLGPFGTATDGESFRVTNVAAFGGNAESTSHLGLNGLCFFKALNSV